MSSSSSSVSFHTTPNHNSENNNSNHSPIEEGDQKMCQSTRKLSMFLEASHRTQSNDTEEDGNSSIQGTVHSNSSSVHKLKQDEERQSNHHVDKGSNDQNPISDDGDVHFFEGQDGDDKNRSNIKDGSSSTKRATKNSRGHHRSLSDMFSENASISTATTGSKSKEEGREKIVSKLSQHKVDGSSKYNSAADDAISTIYPCQQLRSTSRHTSSSSSSSTVKREDSMHEGDGKKRDISSTSGKKHRRIYSGGVSNPSMAHRRINSGGNAAFISRTVMNGSDVRSKHASQHYYPYPPHQQSYNYRRSVRSLSPTPSPKCHSSSDVKQKDHHYYRDDSEIHKHNYQYHPSGFHPRNYSSSRSQRHIDDSSEAKDPNTAHAVNNGRQGSGAKLSDGEEQIAAAQWLQHFRRSPPVDLDTIGYVDHHSPPQAYPMDHHISTYHPPDSHPPSRHSFPPPNKPSAKNFSRSSSISGSSRNASPLQNFYDDRGSSIPFTYSPFDFEEKNSLPSMSSSMARESSNASSITSVPPSAHHHHHLQHYQYPTQQIQPIRRNGRSYHEGPISQFHSGPKSGSGSPSSDPYHPSYYSKPSAPTDSMKMSSSPPTYPVQQQNHHPFYHHHPSGQYYHQSSPSYIAATHAARDAARGFPPHHPLAMEGRPKQRRQKSTTSVQSKIETDELLFQTNDSQQGTNAPPPPDGYNTYPSKPQSNEEPHYRISPQLFQETLNDLPNNHGSDTGDRSPTLHLSNSYQDSLISSLVGKNSHASSEEQQNNAQNSIDGDKSHHHRNSSMAIFNSLVNAMSEPQIKPHKRDSSMDSIVLDEKLLGEKFLSVEPIQPILSNSAVPQTTPLKSRQSQASSFSQTNSASTHLEETKEAKAPKSNAGRKVTGTVSKRVRRKCSIEGCSNRVVQGGLCIAHGAKRKKCAFPGCTKNVKKAGMCSAHGPARKRCEMEGCQKVAVQGGKCIAHGAKKKLCKVDACKKQAILGGMCKKHHDMDKAGKLSLTPDQDQAEFCRPVGTHSYMFTKENKGNSPDNDDVDYTNSASSKSSHRRGLSIFQDMSAVNTIIGSVSSETATVEASVSATATSPVDSTSSPKTNGSSSKGGKSTHNRGLSIFAEEEVVNKIVKNEIGI